MAEIELSGIAWLTGKSPSAAQRWREFFTTRVRNTCNNSAGLMLLRLEPGKITVRMLVRVVRADLSLLRKALVRWVPLTDLHVDVSEGAMFPRGGACQNVQSVKA